MHMVVCWIMQWYHGEVSLEGSALVSCPRERQIFKAKGPAILGTHFYTTWPEDGVSSVHPWVWAPSCPVTGRWVLGCQCCRLCVSADCLWFHRPPDALASYTRHQESAASFSSIQCHALQVRVEIWKNLLIYIFVWFWYSDSIKYLKHSFLIDIGSHLTGKFYHILDHINICWWHFPNKHYLSANEKVCVWSALKCFSISNVSVVIALSLYQKAYHKKWSQS